jgi:hypothetical protein
LYTSSDFSNSSRKKAIKNAEALSKVNDGLPPLSKGDVVLVEDPEMMPKHTPAYVFPFLIAEILSLPSESESNLPHSDLHIQILRPCDLVSIRKKMVMWRGNDGQLWRTTVHRAAVKLVVELTPRGKTLTAKSLEGCNWNCLPKFTPS